MLKKFVVVVAFILIIMVASYSQFNIFKEKQVTFSKNYSQGEFFTSNINNLRARYQSKGFSFKVDDGNLDFLTTLNAKEVYKSQIEKIENAYYYTNQIKTYQIINGERVNVHVAKSTDGITVGIPIIYYGY